MRLPPYSTRAANPQSMVIDGDLPNESYKMVTRFGVLATAMCASSRMKTAKARKEMCRILVPPWCSVLFLIDVARIGPPYGEYTKSLHRGFLGSGVSTRVNSRFSGARSGNVSERGSIECR